MRAGQLRHRIAIERRSGARNSFGEEKEDWSTSETTWGSISPLRGVERFEARQIHPQVTHKVVFRSCVDLDSSDRLNFKGRIFNIDSVILVDERDIKREILCTEEK